MKIFGNLFIFNWSDVFIAGVDAVGGKGWNLGRLHRYGFKVPIGGVLTTQAYQRFVEENALIKYMTEITRSITIDNLDAIDTEKKLQMLREKIEAGHIPPDIEESLISCLENMEINDKPLAIRSSATAEDSANASFAGVHDSYLNVRGPDKIISAIKRCYASLWTLRAVAYRRKMNINDYDICQAVVIMEMVNSKASGTGFSADPRSGREDILLISANFGLGESVVSGSIEPDEYWVNHWYEIVEKRIGSKQGCTIARDSGGTDFIATLRASEKKVLKDEQIGKLACLIQRVFDALGEGVQHQDIEWTFDGQDFVLVQARPITVMPRYTFAAIKNQPDIWSNANLSDTMPMVLSTLNWNFYKRFCQFSDVLGYKVPPGLQGIRLYQGRAYVNLSIQQWFAYDAYGFKPHQTNELWGGHQPEIEISENSPYGGIQGLKRMFRLGKLIVLGIKTRKNAQQAFDRVSVFHSRLLEEDFRSMADEDIIHKFDAIRSTYVEYYPVFISCAATADMSQLTKALEKYLPGKGKAYANALMVGSGDITSATQGYRLVELAEIARGDISARKFMNSEPFIPLRWEQELPENSPFKQSLRDFLVEYGHRTVYELEIMNARWREDPSYLLDVVRSTMETADLSKIRARQQQKANEAWRNINQKVPYLRKRTIRRLVKQALKSMEIREMSKSILIKISECYRVAFQEVGRRLAEKEILKESLDIYHCSWGEMISIIKGDWNGRGLNILVDERKEYKRELDKLSPPDFIIDEAPKFTETVAAGSGHEIRGLGVAAGIASGAARLIKHPHQGAKLKSGDVLVAPTTDPGWTPLFLRASGIIVETGGAGSHGAIVAREYGIPAVVNLRGAMQVISDGQTVVVDGDEGKVFLK